MLVSKLKAMDPHHLRTLVEWHHEYRPAWDGDPEQYVAHDLVGWGRSRRLGLLRLGGCTSDTVTTAVWVCTQL